jgi:hypothetical protein
LEQLMCLLHGRHFGDAGVSPRGPEANYHDFAVQGGEGEGSPLVVR